MSVDLGLIAIMMACLLDDDISSEYAYIPKNKLPHRLGFFSRDSTHYPFDDKDYQETVLPWLRKHIGKHNINWKHGYISKVVSNDGYNIIDEPPPDFVTGNIDYVNIFEKVMWGDGFYFKSEEDAILFKLTWG